MEIGKKYLIIYDDKGKKLVKKTGIIVSIESNLITLDNGEVLNALNLIRAQKLEGGYSGSEEDSGN